ncbi:MAG: nickel-dependent hydrogenase large subunit [Eubacteriales bacterium]
MAERIVINPLTRISGFLELDADVQNNVVVDARSEGMLFRGFEHILKGRHPFDAIFLTERICGICSTAHSIASSMALEETLGVVVPEQGRYLRDILHGSEYLQNHIRHFYQMSVPDYVRMPEKTALFESENKEYRIPREENDRIVTNYFESLQYSRDAHEMVAVLGGKAPHNHGIFVGGAISNPTADKILKIKALLLGITEFINNRMIPDVSTIARYYSDYFKMGGGYGYFLSYGCFNGYRDLGTLYVDPLTYMDGKISAFDQKYITENIDFSWYKDKMNTTTPYESITEPDVNKAGAYSWVKAARYRGLAFEVGPLARQWLSGEYRNGVSALDRTIARVMETKKVAQIVGVLLDQLQPGEGIQCTYEVPETGQGSGLLDTTRGALGHWLKIEDRVICFYQIIPPSVWNLSSQTRNLKGTVEQALIGTRVRDNKNPSELGIIVRSFDPCVSCATHVYSGNGEPGTFMVVP